MTKTMRSAGQTRKLCTVAQAESAALLSESDFVLKDTLKRCAFQKRRQLQERALGNKQQDQK